MSTDILTVDTVAAMQELARKTRAEGRRIVLVPTMGFLHDGHASLMREGRKRGDLLVTSIFVNPTQFGAGEDFDSYPRDLERDSAIAAAAGVEVIFAPKASDMYPAGYQTWVDVERVSLPLCGKSRPGHFRGVTTVVTKLFNIVQPHVALFGKKDFQQLAVIRRMVADMNMDIEIVGMPIVREADGLAMSSRNSYLSPEERRQALCLSQALKRVRESFASGTTDTRVLRETAVGVISAESAASIDYVEVLDGSSLEEKAAADSATVLALAVRIGKTRLIDNTVLGEEM